MEIQASAYLRYWEGESFAGGSERLEVVVKFKEESKLFKTKIIKELVRLSRKPTYNEYFEEVKNYLTNHDLIIKEVEKVVLKHFNNKSYDDSVNQARKNINEKINEIGKIEVKVVVK